jgi:proline iminopeptidase
MRRWMKGTLSLLGAVTGLTLTAAGVSYMAMERPLVLATVTDDSTLPSLDIQGVRLHLETQGDSKNDTLILLHGGPGNDYRHLLGLTPLSEDYQLVFYDQRGAGLSERVPSNKVDLEQLVSELDAIGRHFSPERKLRILGHSWGGMLAAAYLERHPDRVSHLVLVEPGFLNQEGFDSFIEKSNGGVPGFSLALLGSLWISGIEALKIEGPDEDAALDHFMLNVALSDVPKHPMAGYYCGGTPRPGSFDTWRMGVRSSFALQQSGIDKNLKLKGELVGKNAKDFPREVLFLAGECNTIIGEEPQRRHMKLFSHPKLVVLKDTGHLLLQEKTEEALAEIALYLRRDHK